MSSDMKDPFDEYKRRMEAEGYTIAMQPIQLTPGRFPLPKPYPENWTIERQIIEACREGNFLLEADAKAGPKVPDSSVKPDPKTAVQDNLASKSTNPYIQARAQILSKMDKKTREIIESIEKLSPETRRKAITIDIYDKFCKQVTALGDKLSGLT